MNNSNPSRLTIYFPIFLALALIVGLVLGSRYSNGGGSASGTRFLPLPAYGKVNKIGQILDFIENSYVDSVERNRLEELAIRAILEDLDPHSYYISSEELSAYTEPLEGNFDGIGVEFLIVEDTVRVVTPLEGGPSEKAGIMPGDKIVAVNDEVIAGNGITNQRVMELLRGQSGSEVDVSVLRAGKAEPVEFTLVRDKIPIYSVASAFMSDSITGYIKVTRFARTTYEEFMQAAQKLEAEGMQRLVIDLRSNGGGYLNAAIMLTEEFLQKDQLIVYTEGKAQPRQSYYSTKRGRYSDLPVAVLINEGSASASEIMAGALQDNDRGFLVGRRSFGKGLVQEQIGLSDESAMRLTVARYYTPTGRSIQRPYGEGIEYDEDYMARIERGELSSADSVPLNDSLSYVTPGGKVVYGGGGIMPDVFVPLDTVGASYYFSELSYKGVLNSFGFDYSNRNREALLEKYPRFDDFYANFKLSKAELDQLVEYGLKNQIAYNAEDMELSREVIRLRLKAAIARNLYGNDAFYRLLLDDDNVYDEAMKSFGGSPVER